MNFCVNKTLQLRDILTSSRKLICMKNLIELRYVVNNKAGRSRKLIPPNISEAFPREIKSMRKCILVKYVIKRCIPEGLHRCD